MNQDIRKSIELIESALANVHQIEEDRDITLDDIKSQGVAGNAYEDQHIFDMVDKFVRSSENSWEDKSEALNFMQTVVMGIPLNQEQLGLSAQQNVEAYFADAGEESTEEVTEEFVNEKTMETEFMFDSGMEVPIIITYTRSGSEIEIIDVATPPDRFGQPGRSIDIDNDDIDLLKAEVASHEMSLSPYPEMSDDKLKSRARMFGADFDAAERNGNPVPPSEASAFRELQAELKKRGI